MNRAELNSKVSETMDISNKEASEAVSAVLDALTEALKNGEKVTLVGFGTFQTKTRAAREGRNPQTGAALSIPEKTVAHFKPSPKMLV